MLSFNLPEEVIMKNRKLVYVAVLLCLICLPGAFGASSVVTPQGRINCRDISIGMNKVHLLLENGKKEAIPINSVNSYSLNSKTYVKLPLYEFGKPSGKTVFMELARNCFNFGLYRYDYINTDLTDRVSRYFLYDGNKLYLELDDKALENLCSQFNIPYTTR